MDYRNSQNYVWSMRDLLGQGATGNVYKCRNKNNGDPYAVKVFNNVGMMRPPEVRMREFEVLQKLDHENIVMLFAIEEEFSTRNHAIIMELCTGGSLYTMLEHPKNAYGLDETDFKQVAHDVVAGMKHLREQEIVHRDLKPGNIMKYLKEDGSCIYKLTDFGAARELEPSEHFMSIYGTEEYLHPDLYEKGVMKNNKGKKFFASVDLWSIGVTLYQIATGDLPFRPHGGRDNKQTMHFMITRKESGVISGVQTKENGTIHWSKKLPDHIQISEGLKDLITPVIARCLEGESASTISFDDFFASIQDILTRKVIVIYNVGSCSFHNIYCSPDDCFSSFQESIAVQTGISASYQQMFFRYQQFEPNGMDHVTTYPKTSMDEPILVFGGEHICSIERLPRRKIPAVPKLPNQYDLDNDAALSKLIVNTAYCLKHAVDEYEAALRVMQLVRETFSLHVERKMFDCWNDCRLMESQWLMVNNKYQSCFESQTRELQILDVLFSLSSPSKECHDIREDLQNWAVMKKGTIEELNNQFKPLVEQLKTKMSEVIEDKRLAQEWKLLSDKPGPESEQFLSIVSSFTAVIEDIANRFRKEKFQRRLPFNEEQAHLHDRNKLNDWLTNVESTANRCFSRRSKLHTMLGEWLSRAKTCSAETEHYSKQVQDLIGDYEGLGIEMWDEERKRRTSHLLEQLSTQENPAPKQEEADVPTAILDNQMNEVSRVTKESVDTARENSEQLKRLASLLVAAYSSPMLQEEMQSFHLSDYSSSDDGA